VALGYNITYSQTGIFNFAQGQFVVLGVFLAWFLLVDQGWPWPVAMVAGAFAGGIIGLIEEILAIRPLIGRHGGHATLVTTVGASVVIEGLLLATWAKTPKSVPFFGSTDVLTVLGGRVNPVDLTLIAVAVVVALLLHVASRRTLWGLSGRAATEDPDAAKARGVNVTLLRTSAFVLGGALAGLLGPLIGPKVGGESSIGITLTIFGFVALAAGGFGSYLGCLIGGLAVGLVQAFGSRFLGAEYPPLILFGVLIVILLVKPTGLLGQRGLRAV
jgi:branched-chain amino acid transport system permease protein